MSFRNSIFLFIGAGLTACSFVLNKSIETQSIPVSAEKTAQNPVDSIVSPYKLALDSEMNKKVAVSMAGFVNERPNGNLGNLVTDQLMASPMMDGRGETLCLLNFGGLRSTINKGDVVYGDVFKLLPFDNYLVFVKLKASAAEEMKNWILESGGHPIKGFYIDRGQLLDGDKKPWVEHDFWLLTSDYLLNGGDNASFIRKNMLELQETGVLLRDLFLESITGKTLYENNEKRIIPE